MLRNHALTADGVKRDTVVFSIIDSEWPAVRQHLSFQLDKPRLAKACDRSARHLSSWRVADVRCRRRARAVGTPSFDCSQKLTSTVEQRICKDPMLAALDRKLAEAYAAWRGPATAPSAQSLPAAHRGR